MSSKQSDEELKLQFENVAQELTRRLLNEQRKPSYKIKFPRGYIRKLNDLDSRWPFLSRERRRTVACVIQLCDINRWNLNIWDIGLTAGSVWEWHCTLPVIAVIETLLIEYGIQNKWLNPDVKFKKAIDVLNSKGVYPQKLRDKLHIYRSYRNDIHLYLKDNVKIHDGFPKKYNDAVILLKGIEKHIMSHWKKISA